MGAVTWKAPDVERSEGPLTGPERPMLQAFLDWHRATLLYKCSGLTGEQLAERTVPPSGLSLLGLVRHMTKVERTWFRQRFAGEPVEDLFGGDRAADFERGDQARAAADYARLTEEFKLADAAVAHASLDDTFVHNGEPVSLRLIYLHMIEEYARHLGHADLLRERTDGATGVLPGRGGERHAGRRGAGQGGEDAVVDPAEAEGPHQHVLPAGVRGQHGAALVERVLFVGPFGNLVVCVRSTRTGLHAKGTGGRPVALRPRPGNLGFARYRRRAAAEARDPHRPPGRGRSSPRSAPPRRPPPRNP
jgi:hypothetical protein